MRNYLIVYNIVVAYVIYNITKYYTILYYIILQRKSLHTYNRNTLIYNNITRK